MWGAQGGGHPWLTSLERSPRRRHLEQRSPGRLEAVTKWRRGRWDCVLRLRGWGSWDPEGLGTWAASAAELCGEDPDAPSLGRPRGGVSSRSRESVTEPQTFADSRGPGGPQPGSGRGVHLRWRGHLPNRPGSGRAFVPEVLLRRETSLKKSTWTGDAAPARRPGTG